MLALLVACFCSVFKLVFVRCFGSSYKLERYTPSFLFHSHPPKERVVDPLVGACGLLEARKAAHSWIEFWGLA